MRLPSLTKYLLALSALFMATGCVHDVYYVPVKETFYDSSPAPKNFFKPSATPETTETSAHYTSSVRASKERYQDPSVLGRLHVKSSRDPNESSTVFAVRKDHHGYMAETPILHAIQAGDKKITPHFSIGLHKEHRAMAGLTFRMPF